MFVGTTKYAVLAAVVWGAGVGWHFESASLAAPGRGSAISWGNDLHEALRQASQSGQPVLVHFYTDNCVPCKMLEAKAFKNAELGEAMTRSVIPVKINYDQHRDIAQRYQVTRFPTDLFLHPNGEELYRTVSPQEPADYVKLLDRVAAKNRDWVVERMSRLSTLPPSRPNTTAKFEAASARDGRPVVTQGSVFSESVANQTPTSIPNNHFLPEPPAVRPRFGCGRFLGIRRIQFEQRLSPRFANSRSPSNRYQAAVPPPGATVTSQPPRREQ